MPSLSYRAFAVSAICLNYVFKPLQGLREKAGVFSLRIKPCLYKIAVNPVSLI
jgi:hypothetical protein